jgi:hypothetical protein
MQLEVAIVQPHATPPAPPPPPLPEPDPPPTQIAYTKLIPVGIVTDVVPVKIVCLKYNPYGRLKCVFTNGVYVALCIPVDTGLPACPLRFGLLIVIS